MHSVHRQVDVLSDLIRAVFGRCSDSWKVCDLGLIISGSGANGSNDTAAIAVLGRRDKCDVVAVSYIYSLGITVAAVAQYQFVWEVPLWLHVALACKCCCAHMVTLLFFSTVHHLGCTDGGRQQWQH